MQNRAEAFRALHVPGDPFILVNVWDAGSARMMAALGAKALATSSAAHAFTLGVPDGGQVTRGEALSHARFLSEATPLPLSGDFENGFGHEPEVVAETVRLAGAAGLAGCSIEDTMLPGRDPYPLKDAVARIEAAADVARRLGHDFLITARADGVMLGTYDIAEAIRRVRAFEGAGADVLYVPMPGDLGDLAAVCAAVGKPVNVLCAGPFIRHTLADFASAGAARISLGSSLARVIHKALHDTGEAVLDGDFSALEQRLSSDIIDPMLRKFMR